MKRHLPRFNLMNLHFHSNSSSRDTVDRNRLSCRESNGRTFEHGRSFSVAIDDNCSRCTCLAGKSRCVTVICPKPTCKDYRKVAGKCCEYTCPDNLPISDAKHLAVVLTLSIIFLVILILIIIVWRRTRKYRRYASNVRTECATSEPDEPEPVSPTNQRRSIGTTSPNVSSRTTVHLSTVEPPPYAPPKQPDPESITPCEPPPPYTPQDVSFV